MTDNANAVLQEALSLSVDDRADLVAELIASLDESSSESSEVEVRDAWAREIEQRAGRVLAGQSAGEDWATVRERVSSELTDG